MAQMRKDSWDDCLPLNIISCLLRSFHCYAFSFAAPAGPVWRSLPLMNVFSEVPKTITLTKKRIFQLRFCRSLMCFFSVVSSKCASRHDGVHFFNILTYLNAMLPCRPSLNKVRTESMACSCTQMTSSCICNAPQQCGTRSRPEAFWSFSLENVLCATTVCTFSTSQLPKLVRTCCVFLYFHDFYVLFTFWLPNALRATVAHTFSIWAWGFFDVLTFKFASRYNGVQFLIFHLPRWFSARHFSEPTFWSSRTIKN